MKSFKTRLHISIFNPVEGCQHWWNVKLINCSRAECWNCCSVLTHWKLPRKPLRVSLEQGGEHRSLGWVYRCAKAPALTCRPHYPKIGEKTESKRYYASSLWLEWGILLLFLLPLHFCGPSASQRSVPDYKSQCWLTEPTHCLQHGFLTRFTDY